MNKITKLPNYFSGKLYKHWGSVKTFFNEGSILATKQNKNNSPIQLLITNGGKKRELLYKDGKVMDISDSFGNKRTYIYERLDKDSIKGKMLSSENPSKPPLIVAAKWFLENYHLKKLYMKLNPNNKNTNIFIPAEHLRYINPNEFFGRGKIVKVTEVLAKDFEDIDSGITLPRTVVLKTKDGTEIIQSESAQDNYNISKNLGIISEEFGSNLRTIV